MLEIASAPEKEFTEEIKNKLVSSGIKCNRIKKSQLHIKMNILRNNRADIINNINEWFDDDCYDVIKKYMRTYKKQRDEK